MATDSEQLILAISADTRALRRDLERAGLVTKQVTNGMVKDFDAVGTAEDKLAAKTNAMNDNISRSMRASRQSTAQLGYQINDIVGGLASGQRPLQVLNQQMTQVTQALAGMSGKAALGAIGTALLDPWILIPAAISIASVAMTKFFADFDQGAANSAADLAKLATGLQDIAKMFPGSPFLQSTAQTASDAAKAAATAAGAEKALAAATDEATKAYTELLPALSDAVYLMQAAGDDQGANQLMQAYTDLKTALESGHDIGKAALAVQEALDRESVKHAGSVKELTTNLDKQSAAWTSAQAAVDQVRIAIGAANSETNRATEAMEKAGAATARYTAYLQQLGDFKLTPLGELTPITSEMIGTSAVTEGAAAFQNAVGQINDSTTQLIKSREGFLSSAKWDVNAFRVGFGSDTITDALGRVTKVTQSTTTTVADANRDLARRIVDFQSNVKQAIGAETWASLTENQQAALTSIAYNYGSLPGRIVDAIKAGGGPEVVANAINALGADNAGVNRARRKQEAELFGGAAFTAPAAPKESFQEAFAANQKLIDQQTQELAIRQDSTLTTEQQTEALKAQATAVDTARIAEELLAKARADGLTITPELTAKIQEQAAALAGLKAANDSAQAAQKATLAQQQALAKIRENEIQQLNQMGATALTGFLDDLRHGVDAGEAFNKMLDQIIGNLIQMSIQAAFNPAGGGGGGLFGMLFGAAASGGIVGKTAFPRRYVDPRVFRGAASMQRGGLVGGEVPILAHKGELIVPKVMVDRLRRGGTGTSGRGTTVNNQLGDISIDMAGTGTVAASTDDAKKFGQQIQSAVQMIMVQESRPGGLLRRTQ